MARKLDPQALRLPIRMGKGFLGTRTSLRLGRKWADRLERGPQAVVLLDKDGDVCGTAIAERAAYLRLRDVPRSWLAMDVDPELRDATNPVVALQPCYPSEPINWDSLVTVIWLQRTR